MEIKRYTWDEIPDRALGEITDEAYEADPLLCRCIIAKRALKAGYEEVDDAVADMLTDLLHLCDALDLDFQLALDTARNCHVAELRAGFSIE